MCLQTPISLSISIKRRRDDLKIEQRVMYYVIILNTTHLKKKVLLKRLPGYRSLIIIYRTPDNTFAYWNVKYALLSVSDEMFSWHLINKHKDFFQRNLYLIEMHEYQEKQVYVLFSSLWWKNTNGMKNNCNWATYMGHTDTVCE